MALIASVDIFNEEVEKLRTDGALGRSDVLGRLFDFLVTRTLAGEPPKESEVALEVFGKDGGFDAMQDASVRVAVLRLRRKLDDHYGEMGREPRLYIPKGEYRLGLLLPEPQSDEEIAPEAPAPAPARPAHRRLLLLSLAILLLSIAGWAWMLSRGSGDAAVAEAASAAPWSSLDGSDPVDVVIGDYYIFGENGTGGSVARLVREFAINSKDDLDSYVMMNPELMDRYVDVGLSYLPRGTAAVLTAISPMVHRASEGGVGVHANHILPASTLTVQRIKDGNIVYVGWLSGLGLLREPVFSASKFQIGSTYDELIDRTDGKRFVADWDQASLRVRHRDYGYFASFPGPSGKRIIVIAGIRDAGLMQMGDIVTNPVELKRLARAAGSSSFEALYEVQALDNTNLASRLVAVHALKTQALWDRDGNRTRFPDQFSPANEPHQ